MSLDRVDWRSSDEFDMLCDIVAGDSLVCLTGAGISRNLPRAHPVPGKETVPGWFELLNELFEHFQATIEDRQCETIRRLLDPIDERLPVGRLKSRIMNAAPLINKHLAADNHSEKWLEDLRLIGPVITSRELIVAATLIRRGNETEFDREFRNAVTEKPGEFSPVHSALLDMKPRGIVTFNYDGAHESACKSRGMAYRLLDPNSSQSDSLFRDAMAEHLREFFIVKAHGSSADDAESSLTLTFTDYRSLISKNPSYRAFIQILFTNFHFLMVGYGLDDPDFDLFLWTMAEQFGSPVHDHIIVRPINSRSRRQEIERYLYGINTLFINGWHELPSVLTEATKTIGPKLLGIINLSLSTRHPDRDESHRLLQKLGPAGKSSAAYFYRQLLDQSTESTFRKSEAAYSLGILDPITHKDRLMNLVDETNESDILGRSLTVLRGVLTLADLPRLEHWKTRFAHTPPHGERPERIAVYLEDLLHYLPHKFQSDPAP